MQEPIQNMEVTTGPKPPVVDIKRETGPRFSDIPNTNIRRIIAKRLTESKQTTPHSYISQNIIMDNVLALRAKLNGLDAH
jgi:pyruvate dehydrogenase E2 component (dihydrolipoamide acetyltransferase)